MTNSPARTSHLPQARDAAPDQDRVAGSVDGTEPTVDMAPTLRISENPFLIRTDQRNSLIRADGARAALA